MKKKYQLYKLYSLYYVNFDFYRYSKKRSFDNRHVLKFFMYKILLIDECKKINFNSLLNKN